MSGKKQEELSDADSAIVPVELERVTPVDAKSHANAKSNLRRTAIVAVSIVLFFLVLTVIFILPRYVGTELPVANGGAEAIETPIAGGDGDDALVTAETHDPETAAELRRANQQQLEEALALVNQLEQQNVSAWAADEFDTAVQTIAAGEKAYREQRYLAAEKSYSKAIETLQTIMSRTGEVVADAVDDGFLQLASRDSQGARDAFTFALSIEPGHDQAKKGLTRAETLDEVLALINEAEGYERLDALDEALNRYREALAIDAQAPGAASALARVEQIQLDAKFRAVMSEGFAAFDEKRDARARSAFERARKIKPNSTEATEALAQVKNRILANKISQHLGAAIKFERDEKWTQAAQQYRSAVNLDADLDGAAASAKRAVGRAKLDQQLETTIGKPRRLANDAVHKEAQAILRNARSITEPGARLSGQINRLSSAIRIARTPIAVTLVSDNATEVTLYKVGPLGHFEQHSVSIIPGRYVVVGRRDGFRDVRVEFEVSPEHGDAMITVRCEQKLAFGS